MSFPLHSLSLSDICAWLSFQMNVKEFKEHIAASVSIPSEKQRLIYQGRVLQDDKKLQEYSKGLRAAEVKTAVLSGGEKFTVYLFFSADVGGKVIHLVERAPPQTQLPSGASSGTGSASATHGGAPLPGTRGPGASVHDRNANSYVMVGTFNLPVSLCFLRGRFCWKSSFGCGSCRELGRQGLKRVRWAWKAL